MVRDPDGRFIVLDDPPHSVVKWFRAASKNLSPPIEEAVGEPPGEDVLYVLVRTDKGVGVWADEQHPLDARLQMQPDVLGVPTGTGLLRFRQGTVGPRRKTRGMITLTWDGHWRDSVVFDKAHAGDLHIGIRTIQVHRGRIYLWLTAADGRQGGQFFVRIARSGRPIEVTRVADARGDVIPNNARPLVIGPRGTIFQWYTSRTHAELRRQSHKSVRLREGRSVFGDR